MIELDLGVLILQVIVIGTVKFDETNYIKNVQHAYTFSNFLNFYYGKTLKLA